MWGKAELVEGLRVDVLHTWGGEMGEYWWELVDMSLNTGKMVELDDQGTDGWPLVNDHC